VLTGCAWWGGQAEWRNAVSRFQRTKHDTRLASVVPGDDIEYGVGLHLPGQNKMVGDLATGKNHAHRKS